MAAAAAVMEAALMQATALVLVEPRVVEPRVAVTVLTAALMLVELHYSPAPPVHLVHHSLSAKEVMAAARMMYPT